MTRAWLIKAVLRLPLFNLISNAIPLHSTRFPKERKSASSGIGISQ